MARQKTDSDYLKSEEIGLVIAKGMAVMYKENPKNPVDFLAKWLLNYSQVERAVDQSIEYQRLVEDHKIKNQEKINAEELKKEEERKELALADAKKDSFMEKIKKSNDLATEMQSLTDQLKE